MSRHGGHAASRRPRSGTATGHGGGRRDLSAAGARRRSEATGTGKASSEIAKAVVRQRQRRQQQQGGHSEGAPSERARTAATAAEARTYRRNGCIRGARAEHQMTHAYTSTRNGSKRSVALALVICGDVWPCAALQALATPLLMPLACMKTTSHRALADHRWFVGIRKAQAGAWSIYSF